jgi:16S rRNA G1207 methylase RsmC
MPKRKRAFEWCCGPGFIGFSMLGHGLCESLCLSDINPAFLRASIPCVSTSSATVFPFIDNLKSIPRSEMWNLIVSKPPHFVDQYEGDIRAHDPDWRIHRNFFETVSDHLAEDGV